MDRNLVFMDKTEIISFFCIQTAYRHGVGGTVRQKEKAEPNAENKKAPAFGQNDKKQAKIHCELCSQYHCGVSPQYHSP